MPRLFVALRPPPEIRATLRALMAGVSGARWQSDAQLHLTLRYIGEVDAIVAARIGEALAELRAPQVELRLAGVGTFDRRGRVHTLWAGVAPRDPLSRLRDMVDQILIGIAPPPDPRPFVPHITLARRALGNDSAAETVEWRHRHAALSAPPFVISDLSLYDSVPAATGTEYRAVRTCRLHD